ncbi:methyltransferase domain-containing protein [Secundilactobacillus paracollinoides]|uniref:SAM-dependent methyltransferase n=1 Tax=Secundilactobacillus paracollinoides TaxID=240427 RepID=A0A1B2IXN6_9LACO|nr:methyltransferase domain-containing protein [Secundilactobacillus paracollinoides]ANZ60978.1 SAM-dependent methyltransferase [Secundilactobacillus paracollinoides]ANZ66836.1 SAM-dependent methyltransferase [Secundilactobacillus paracollinoides]
MNKIALASQFLTAHLNQFECPVCHAPFTAIDDGTLRCQNDHTFDLSKKGTLFFLNAPVNTEYTDEMLRNRQQMLTSGFFEPMLGEVVKHLQGDLVLDAGSGEGTTTKWLASHYPSGDFVGLDISKPAINIAGSGVVSDPQPLFAVGDLAKLPFETNALSSIVNILSPANYQEFDRVLQPGGVLIKVIPNSHYLTELRQFVYPEGEHATYDNAPVKQHFIAQYGEVDFVPVQYQFELTPALFKALFAMTPLTWQASEERRNEILNQGLPNITADFEVGIVHL